MRFSNTVSPQSKNVREQNVKKENLNVVAQLLLLLNAYCNNSAADATIAIEDDGLSGRNGAAWCVESYYKIAFVVCFVPLLATVFVANFIRQSRLLPLQVPHISSY